MNQDDESSSALNSLSPNQSHELSSIPNLRKHKMNDSHWDVNGDEGFDDPMIEDTGYAEQDEGWSRRGSRIILGDDHEDEERLSIQAEKIVHKGFFNNFADDFDDKDVA